LRGTFYLHPSRVPLDQAVLRPRARRVDGPGCGPWTCPHTPPIDAHGVGEGPPGAGTADSLSPVPLPTAVAVAGGVGPAGGGVSLDPPFPADRHRPRVGSLCTGYGGLDLAVQAVLGGHLRWYAETDRHARTVLAHRFPGVANLGDIRIVDWATLAETASVDILTAGFPCQDIPAR
jgi:hypothetical protein